MRGISRLHHYEPVEIDRTQLDVLILELGEQGAERVVARALEELALRLERIDQAYRNLDIRRAAKATTGLAAAATLCWISSSFCRLSRPSFRSDNCPSLSLILASYSLTLASALFLIEIS